MSNDEEPPEDGITERPNAEEDHFFALAALHMLPKSRKRLNAIIARMAFYVGLMDQYVPPTNLPGP